MSSSAITMTTFGYFVFDVAKMIVRRTSMLFVSQQGGHIASRSAAAAASVASSSSAAAARTVQDRHVEDGRDDLGGGRDLEGRELDSGVTSFA